MIVAQPLNATAAAREQQRIATRASALEPAFITKRTPEEKADVNRPRRHAGLQSNDRPRQFAARERTQCSSQASPTDDDGDAQPIARTAREERKKEAHCGGARWTLTLAVKRSKSKPIASNTFNHS